MSRLAFLAFGAALAIAPAQTSVPAEQRPTTPTTGPNTTGTPEMGATVPGQVDREKPGAPQKKVAASRGDQETGTPVAGSAVSGPATVKGNAAAGAAASGPSLPAGSAATATTHSGSTPIAADQSGVRTRENGSPERTMPETSAGWLGMLLGGSALGGAGAALRRRK